MKAFFLEYTITRRATMVWIILCVLAIVQGLTEFLPISSSGHLVLLYQWFGIEDQTILLSVLLHIATLCSVLLYYRKTIWELLKHPFCYTNRCLIVATIPTVVFVLLFRNIITYAFGGDFLWLGFLLTGFLLSLASMLTKKEGIVPYQTYSVTKMPIGYLDAILMGMGQGIACFPAVSRSGTTIATGLFLGLPSRVSVDFSFLMSIPVILGSLLFELIENKFVLYLSYSIPQICVAFLICFVVGIFAIKLLKNVAQNHKLSLFSKYLYTLSVVLIVLQLYQMFFR